MSTLMARLQGYVPLNQQVKQRPWLVLLVIPALLLVLHPWRGGSNLDGDAWSIIARHKTGERLSRGALRQQGARSHIRENLRDDRDYLFTMVGAGWNNQVFQIASCMSPLFPMDILLLLQRNLLSKKTWILTSHSDLPRPLVQPDPHHLPLSLEFRYARIRCGGIRVL